MPEDIIRIGNVEIISLSDADLNFPAADFFPTISAETWNSHRQYLGDDGNLHPNAGCFADIALGGRGLWYCYRLHSVCDELGSGAG